jgi:hypothetical protein
MLANIAATALKSYFAMRLARSAIAIAGQQKTETEIRRIEIGLGSKCGQILRFCFRVVSRAVWKTCALSALTRAYVSRQLCVA